MAIVESFPTQVQTVLAKGPFPIPCLRSSKRGTIPSTASGSWRS